MKDKFVISPENPFLPDFIQMQNGMKTRGKWDGQLKSREMVVTYREEYWNGPPWAKLYQNKQMLDDLSPNACKLLIHIAINLEWNAEKIQIIQHETGLSRRTFPSAILELLTNRIVVKEKREWYWINVTLLIIGRPEKPLTDEQQDT